MKTETPRAIAERIVRETIFIAPGRIADKYADAIEAALNAERERCAKIAEDFDDWIFCTCSECRADARSHAVKTEPSLERIAAAIRQDKCERIEIT